MQYKFEWVNPIPGSNFEINGLLFAESGVMYCDDELVDFFYFKTLQDLGSVKNLQPVEQPDGVQVDSTQDTVVTVAGDSEPNKSSSKKSTSK